MDLIVSHLNADFDSLGSLVAARKLYPDSRLLLPGSQEAAVREFLSLSKDLVKIETERECDLEGIDRLILVDTRHKSRIGIAGQLIDRGVDVHIYDHHPRTKCDITADKDVYEEVGATVTILGDLIKRKRIKLTPFEATMMLLGIYEETGSLTYRTTTKLDVDMVSFLLSCGATLSVVSSYVNRELTEEELSFLTKLLNGTERLLINGVGVSIVEVDSGDYRGELGVLINKLMDIENISALFVFVKRPSGKVHLIARSKIFNLDVNRVLSSFGGGGHSTAASAKIQTQGVGVLREKLIKILRSNIKIKLFAMDVMSPAKPKIVNVNHKVNQVKSILMKNRSYGTVVMDKKRIVGIVSLEHLNRAIRRGYGHARVKGYMSTKVVSVGPRTPLHAIQKIIFEKGAGIIPVMKASRLIGIINRTDVLKKVHNGLFAKPHSIERKVTLNLSKKIKTILPAMIYSLLKRIGTLANDMACTAFVVGGLVRDLLLGYKNLDLDIVIEGDAIEYGKTLSDKLNGALVIHQRFGTASVVIDWPKKAKSQKPKAKIKHKKKLKIDIASARQESYERPAALPKVEFSRLKDDLLRRDFTINAMAVSLNKESFGQLIDFFGGERDLASGKIKVLHDGSFIDDPTRIFRAVRFEQRFRFVIDSHTEELIRHAIEKEMFDKTAKQRIRDEIVLILQEEKPLRALRRMEELHEFRFIHPRIKLNTILIKLFQAVEDVLRWYDAAPFRRRSIEKWLVYFMVLLNDLGYSDVEDICNKFVFRRSEKIRILSFKKKARSVLRTLDRTGDVLPSTIYRTFEPLSYETILAIMVRAKSRGAKKRVEDFFSKYNGAKLRIRGEDIKALGLKPGPEFKKVLDGVLYKKIDGKLRTKKDELEFARKIIIKKYTL